MSQSTFDRFDPNPASLPEGEAPPVRRRLPSGQAVSSVLLLGGIIACVLLTAILIAATGGVVAGQRERSLRATQTTTADLSIQFQLGLADMEQGRYELAAGRFRWILERVPDYPGAAEWLGVAERMLGQPAVPEPGVIPTSSAITLDERFEEATALFEAEQWEAAIARLREIQALDANFRTIEVREMLYEALTTLGLIYVRGNRIEEGIILLDEAAQIHPLDDQTAGERYIATLYVTGRTYWGLNWPIVINNFEAILEVAPYYRDVSDRLWEAYIRYGDQLVLQGLPCDAAEQYEAALRIRNEDAAVEKYNQSTDVCLHLSPTPSLTPLSGIPTATLEPGIIPSATPTPEGQGLLPEVPPFPTATATP